MVSRTTSGRSPAATIDWSSVTSATKTSMLVWLRVARLGASSARWSASQNVMLSRLKRSVMHSTARSPMPRLGVLRIRRSDT